MRLLILFALAAFVPFSSSARSAEPGGDVPSQAHRRAEPWTSSRVRGTPEPPPPYTLERVYEELELELPTEMVRLPGTDRWVVVQLQGPIVSFADDDPADHRVALAADDLESKSFRGYGIAFHPKFPQEPWCYIAYSVAQRHPAGTRLSRFRVTDVTQPVIDGGSEQVLLEWDNHGHTGGSIHFDREGYLYVSVGDGQPPNPPDANDTGQDLTDLEGSILRIDVDHHGDGRPYSVPPDNPFLDDPSARDEIFAFGFRNPWKMAFDPDRETLWTGDVGWEMLEMVYRVDRGGNYGWSVMEGSQPVKPEGERYPVPITPPVVEHSHIEARSVTGGYFWQSERLPELRGAYLYGDWMTGKIWGLRHDGEAVTWHRELADTTLQIICFALDRDGEVLVVGYDGSIHRLVPREIRQQAQSFPTRLSETGLFASTEELRPAPGVVEYEINAHRWADGTQSRQWIAVPGEAQLAIHESNDWTVGQVRGHVAFPPDTVLAKTVEIETDPGNPASTTRLETQLLHRYGDSWNAYNYVWNDEQTDAELQENVAIDRTLEISDPDAPGGIRRQVWHHASRDECLLCHIWRAGTVHGFKLQQLELVPPGESENQLDRLTRLGLFPRRPERAEPLVSPYDRSASLENRARSYLDLNCGHCHRPGGGGTATIDLTLEPTLAKTGLVGAKPEQGQFGIEDARLVAPGDPYRSVLLYRLIKSGRGHMPQIGSRRIDREGVLLIHDWIASIQPTGEDATDQAQGSTCVAARQQAEATIQTWIRRGVGEKAAGEKQVEADLSSPEEALAVAVQLMESEEELAPAQRVNLASFASRHERGEVRELFEHFLPLSQRKNRLGTAIDEAALLAREGDIERGRQLFAESADVSCRQCHMTSAGKPGVGPSLPEIAARLNRKEILASILRPSEKIEPRYQTWIALTADGVTVTGLIREQDEQHVTLVDASGKAHRLPRAELEVLQRSPNSLMPDRLLADFTAEQAADLLAFLDSWRQDESNGR